MAVIGSAERISWSMSKDDEGFRVYEVTFLVRTSSPDDGPQIVATASGLPAIGSYWDYGNDADTWAMRTPYFKVTQLVAEKEPCKVWSVECKFSTKPRKRCQDTAVENPLLEPQKVSGSFVRTREEATYDRYGNLIESSSHEQIRGPQVEFDTNSLTVHIEQNVADLDLPLVASMMDCVNDATLWGMEKRCVKLSQFSFEMLIYGSCTYYYKRVFDFEVNANTFDRDVLDQGTRVLRGHWARTGETGTLGEWVLDPINGSAPDPNNPQHFIRFKDPNGENCEAILDGAGKPISSTYLDWDGILGGTGGFGILTGTGDEGTPGRIHIEKYNEANFLLLGIPTDLATLGT